jgi:PilZ domain
MQEARQSERAKTHLGAKIVFNNRASVIDCVIRNFSAFGAKLGLTDSLPVPREFELRIPQKAQSYRARSVWRNSEGMGVEFQTADTERLPKERIRELEAENAELKERIRILSKRLAELERAPNISWPDESKMP